MATTTIPATTREAIAKQLKSAPIERVSAALGVHHSTLKKAMAGDPVSRKIAERLTMTASRTRDAAEFAGTSSDAKRAPRSRNAITSWSLESIRSARDEQMNGHFALPVRMAEAMRTDDAIFTARQARVAPQDAIATRIVAAPHGARLAERARTSVQLSRGTIKNIHGTLVDHGIAIGINRWSTNAEGTQRDLVLEEWPLEFVRWDASREVLQTATLGGPQVEIVHGDGTWVIFKKYDAYPWRQEACILPAALIWAAHAEGLSDWSGSTRSHGLSKIMGKLGEGVSIRGDGGALTPEAQAFLDILLDVASGDAAVGLIPRGAEADVLSDSSTAWQVFERLILNRERGAARVYLGTDGILGATGGAPGVDIAQLFGVATTKLQGDFVVIQNALKTGCFEPWAAVNVGDSRAAPWLEYQLPDPDADSKHEEITKGYERLARTVKALKDQGAAIDQELIDVLAERLGVSPAPKLAAASERVASIQLAPTDAAKLIRAVEGRAAMNLGPFGDARDQMTIPELETMAATPPATPPATRR